MNRRSVAAEVAHIQADIKGMDAEDIKFAYSIEIKDNGSVYDLTYEKSFKSLTEWVIFCNDQDGDEIDDDLQYGRFDDEDN